MAHQYLKMEREFYWSKWVLKESDWLSRRQDGDQIRTLG